MTAARRSVESLPPRAAFTLGSAIAPAADILPELAVAFERAGASSSTASIQSSLETATTLLLGTCYTWTAFLNFVIALLFTRQPTCAGDANLLLLACGRRWRSLPETMEMCAAVYLRMKRWLDGEDHAHAGCCRTSPGDAQCPHANKHGAHVCAALVGTLTLIDNLKPVECPPSSDADTWSQTCTSVYEQPSVRALLPVLLASAGSDAGWVYGVQVVAARALQHLPRSAEELLGARQADAATVLQAAAVAAQRRAQREEASGGPLPSSSQDAAQSIIVWVVGVRAATLSAGVVATLADGTAVPAGSAAPLLASLEQWAETLPLVNKAHDAWMAQPESWWDEVMASNDSLAYLCQASFWHARLASALLRLSAKHEQFCAVVAAAAGTAEPPAWAAGLLDACLAQARPPFHRFVVQRWQPSPPSPTPAARFMDEQREWLAAARAGCKLVHTLSSVAGFEQAPPVRVRHLELGLSGVEHAVGCILGVF